VNGWVVLVVVCGALAAIMLIAGSLVRRKTERITQEFIDDMLRAEFWRMTRARRRRNRR